MSAAAVIPAPIAYIKVVAVKARSWISGPGSRFASRRSLPVLTYLPVFPRCSSLSASGGRNVYFEKIRVLKAGGLPE